MDSFPGAQRLLALFVAMAALLGSAGCEVRERPLPHAGASAAQVARGQALLAQNQCGTCHAIPGVDAARGAVGPRLAAFSRRSYIAGHLPNGPDILARWIVPPSALVPCTTMPSMVVSDFDARDIASYLLSLE